MALNSIVIMAKGIGISTKGDNHKDEVGEKRATRSRLLILCCVLPVLCSMLFMAGCASMAQTDAVLAVVDGDPVTEGDLKYSLTVKHRKEDLSSAGALDLMHYVNKMIDDRLLVHEARSAGMDRLPEIRQAIKAYILRESVVRLHRQEIVDPVRITDGEMKDYYRENYEQFRMGILEIKSDEEARDILGRLKKGGDFTEFVKRYPAHHSAGNPGELTMRRLSMSPQIFAAVSLLKPDEYSDVIKQSDTFYILKLLSRVMPPENEFDKVKDSIQKALRKNRESELSDEYLKSLRAKTKVTVHDGLLAELKAPMLKKEMEKGASDRRPLIEVGGDVLTSGEFISMMSQTRKKSEHDVINGWIERKLIDQEALGRHYEEQSDLKGALSRYESELLRQIYINRVIRPQIKMTDEAAGEYYRSHQSDYMRPARYKLQMITAGDEGHADRIANNLKNGADFSWVANQISSGSSAGGNVVTRWTTIDELPVPAREVVDGMSVGDISPVIDAGKNTFIIFRLQDKHEKTVEDFGKIRDAVRQSYFDEQTGILQQQYLNRLKEGVEIRVFSREIASLEARLQK